MVTSTYRSVWSREEKNHRLCVRACVRSWFVAVSDAKVWRMPHTSKFTVTHFILHFPLLSLTLSCFMCFGRFSGRWEILLECMRGVLDNYQDRQKPKRFAVVDSCVEKLQARSICLGGYCSLDNKRKTIRFFSIV